MKNKIWFHCLFVLAWPTLVWAQPQNQQQGQNNNNDISRRASSCQQTLKECAPKTPTEEASEQKNCEEYDLCESLKYTAKLNNETILSPREQAGTIDQKIACQKVAGYTMDFNACKGTGATYDAIQLLEKAMFETQKQDLDATNQNIQQEANAQAAQGNIQVAALDATKQTVLKLKQLNEQQVAAYGAAVGALFTALQQWPTTQEALVSQCQNVPIKKEDGDQEANSPGKCATSVGMAFTNAKGEVLANANAKNLFDAALQEYLLKAAKAGIEVYRLGVAADQIQQVKDGTQSDGDAALFDRCIVAPATPGCSTAPGVRVSGPGFIPGDFSVGTGDTNSFDIGNNGGADFGELGAETNVIDDKDRVSVTSSPFADAARSANKILNPAGAASLTPTGGAGGGGGGGSGGGGGGGSASLGDDLQGVDDNANKENDIKTNKVSASYSSGGSGFSGIKAAKEGANPFASLFDGKSSGGVTEDRSVASGGDIDGAASGIWQKLSNRYQKVRESNRIEAKNLE